MKKKLLLIGSYILVAALATVVTLASVALGAPEEDYSKLEELKSLILERYVGEADVTAMEDAAADAMVTATGDRWSYYISASEYQDYLERMANEYVGVGITIQMTEENAGFLIIEVAAGGPAEEAGMLAGDVVIAVAGQDVRGMGTDGVRDLVRGEPGTFVDMTVLRDGDALTLSVERRHVKVPVATYQMLDGNIGLVTIENFDSRCAEETIAAIEALLDSGMEMLILDVRNNPGGYASELVKVLDYLLPEGEVFRTVSYNGKENVDYSDENHLDIPMAVLVNGSSYSAAEFFAAAMAEYEAAVVVGEPTSGKGYFQNTLRLEDGSAVALSVGRYFTPKGNCLEGVGIVPDVLLVLDEETDLALYYGTLTPEEDPHIQAAINALMRAEKNAA